MYQDQSIHISLHILFYNYIKINTTINYRIFYFCTWHLMSCVPGPNRSGKLLLTVLCILYKYATTVYGDGIREEHVAVFSVKRRPDAPFCTTFCLRSSRRCRQNVACGPENCAVLSPSGGLHSCSDNWARELWKPWPAQTCRLSQWKGK